MISGVITGILIGIVSKEMIRRLGPLLLKEKRKKV